MRGIIVKKASLTLIDGSRKQRNLTIKESIENKLNNFQKRGFNTSLNYQASICDFNELQLKEENFSRILFHLCALTGLSQKELKIQANNCSQFFILSIDCKGCDLPPLSKGIALPTERNFSPALFGLQEIGGHVHTQVNYHGSSQVILRIPLQSNEDQGSPLRRAFFMP